MYVAIFCGGKGGRNFSNLIILSWSSNIHGVYKNLVNLDNLGHTMVHIWTYNYNTQFFYLFIPTHYTL